MQNSKIGLRIVGGLGLLWNLLGSMNFMMQMKADALANMPEPFHTIVANRPSWATAAFGLGVFAGTIGCILLLLKRREAIYVFAVSLVGLTVHLLPYISGANLPAEFGLTNMLLVFVAPLTVAAFLLWYASKKQS
jgi:uncharacterized membrane protein